MRLAETLRGGTFSDQAAQLRQPEVQDLEPPVAGHAQITWFHIPVDDPAFVSCRQAFCKLCSKRDELLCRQRSLGHLLAECDSGDVLHHQKIQALQRVEIMDGCDVRM